MAPYPTRSIRAISSSSKPYTFIVVGGGTAGCVLAARLSEDPQTTVLLIERGSIVNGWAAGVPLLSSNFTDQRAPVYKWDSAPLEAVNGRKLTMVAGKALGGSGKINGLIYTRSVPGEYNAWEKAGRKGWGWEDVRPYFEKSEMALGNGASYRGSTGPWQTRGVDNIRFQPVASNIAAVSALGVPSIDKANNPDASAICCTRLDATIDASGRRSATSDAFLPKKLVQERRNLLICTGAIVLSLSVKNGRAVGVFVEEDGDQSVSPQRYEVFAEREVTLCAGAIGTPQILLLSGIGPEAHLMERKIPVLKHLPGVGAHLQDHISVPLLYKVPIADSIDMLLKKPFAALGELLRYCFTGRGIFGTQVQQANIMLQSRLLDDNSRIVSNVRVKDGDPEHVDGHDPANIPDLEIMLIPVNPTERKFELGRSAGTFAYLCTLLRPQSCGSVRLASTSARDQPICDLGMLSSVADRLPLRKVLKAAQALARAVQTNGYQLEDLLVPSSQSDKDLDRFVDENLRTTYHYASSCRMAEEADNGVVDDQLRVHGIAGLRIADASVFPQVPACHLQAPVVMIAERCADFVRLA
ncbi:GMC oxidoreductase [Mycena crocata]|nr:GMC oxidoreductase [Mycena crocata]